MQSDTPVEPGDPNSPADDAPQEERKVTPPNARPQSESPHGRPHKTMGSGEHLQLLQPIIRAHGWIKLVGVLLIISFLLQVISSIGTMIFTRTIANRIETPFWVELISLPDLILQGFLGYSGLLLFSASKHLGRLQTTGVGELGRTALEELGRSFKLWGIVGLVLLCIRLIGVIMGFALILSAQSRLSMLPI